MDGLKAAAMADDEEHHRRTREKKAPEHGKWETQKVWTLTRARVKFTVEVNEKTFHANIGKATVLHGFTTEGATIRAAAQGLREMAQALLNAIEDE